MRRSSITSISNDGPVIYSNNIHYSINKWCSVIIQQTIDSLRVMVVWWEQVEWETVGCATTVAGTSSWCSVLLVCSVVWEWPVTTVVEAMDCPLPSFEPLTLNDVNVCVLLLNATKVDVELLQLFSNLKKINQYILVMFNERSIRIDEIIFWWNTGKSFGTRRKFHALGGDGQMLLFDSIRFVDWAAGRLTSCGAGWCAGRQFLRFCFFFVRRFADFDAVESTSSTADGNITDRRTATPLIASAWTGERTITRTSFRTSSFKIVLNNPTIY